MHVHMAHSIVTTFNSESGPITRIMTTTTIKSVLLAFYIHLLKKLSELSATACKIRNVYYPALDIDMNLNVAFMSH